VRILDSIESSIGDESPKSRTRLLRSGTTLSFDGCARTLFETSRWGTIGIQLVLRHTNGSEPAVCSFPIFDPR
jgi:hypothetical protein